MVNYESLRSYPRPLDPVQVSAVTELIEDVLPGRILEVGCATGKLLTRLHEMGCEPIGVDLNLTSLQASDKATTVQANANSLPFVDGVFDLVIANHVIEHTQHVGHFVGELARVTRPDGKIFLAYPHEPVRGLFASVGSLLAFGHPFGGRRLHIQTIRPENFDELSQSLPIKHIDSRHSWLPLPQFMTILSKVE